MAPLRRCTHHGTAGTDECRCAGDDAPELGPDRQCDDEPRYHVECGQPDLRTVQGGTRGAERDHGEGPLLVPGGATNTPMISDGAGFDRAKLIQPEVMAPPLLWLVSDAAGKV